MNQALPKPGDLIDVITLKWICEGSDVQGKATGEFLMECSRPYSKQGQLGCVFYAGMSATTRRPATTSGTLLPTSGAEASPGSSRICAILPEFLRHVPNNYYLRNLTPYEVCDLPVSGRLRGCSGDQELRRFTEKVIHVPTVQRGLFTRCSPTGQFSRRKIYPRSWLGHHLRRHHPVAGLSSMGVLMSAP